MTVMTPGDGLALAETIPGARSARDIAIPAGRGSFPEYER